MRKSSAFLNDWASRKYTDAYNGREVLKTFGLSRSTTLLHFISVGHHPIFDSCVRKAMNKPLGWRVPNTIPWYVDVFRPLFSEIAVLCGTDNLRRVNMALFSYGARQLPFSD